jgi:hypothetical protein
MNKRAKNAMLDKSIIVAAERVYIDNVIILQAARPQVVLPVTKFDLQ